MASGKSKKASPSDKGQAARSAANKTRLIKKAEAEKAKAKLKKKDIVPHGMARADARGHSCKILGQVIETPSTTPGKDLLGLVTGATPATE